LPTSTPLHEAVAEVGGHSMLLNIVCKPKVRMRMTINNNNTILQTPVVEKGNGWPEPTVTLKYDSTDIAGLPVRRSSISYLLFICLSVYKPCTPTQLSLY
jgi:hypothetical protein